jgi:hypothetical protein
LGMAPLPLEASSYPLVSGDYLFGEYSRKGP